MSKWIYISEILPLLANVRLDQLPCLLIRYSRGWARFSSLELINKELQNRLNGLTLALRRNNEQCLCCERPQLPVFNAGAEESYPGYI